MATYGWPLIVEKLDATWRPVVDLVILDVTDASAVISATEAGADALLVIATAASDVELPGAL